jgi:hypothetical protein
VNAGGTTFIMSGSAKVGNGTVSGNAVFLPGGKYITVNTVLTTGSAIVQLATNVNGTQVLAGSAIPANYDKFKVKIGGSLYLLDSGGNLVYP